jgi:hypothetical protein
MDAGRIEVEVTGELPPRQLPRGWAGHFALIALDSIRLTLESGAGQPIDVILTAAPGTDRLFVSRPPPSAMPPPGTYDVTVFPGSGALPVRLGRQRIGDGVVRWKVALSPGAVVEGHVRDAAGEPVRGARVEAGPVGWTHTRSRIGGHASDTTDAEGRYSLAGLSDGEIEIVVRAGEESGAVVETSKRITVSAERSTRLDLNVPVGGSVEVWLAPEARMTTGFRLTLTAKEGGLVRTIERTARQVADDRRGDGSWSYPWRMEGVAIGEHTVEVVWDGVELPVTEIEVIPLQTSLLTLPPR